jgi:hypothetical protein
VRLDHEAVDAIKKARLHRKVATAIFFESNGGQAKGEATVPETRLAVAEPGLDIGNVETVTETLSSSCYYLSVDRNRYRFSLSPNLNKLLADRRASIQPEKINERVRAEVQKVFAAGSGVERVFFPDKSGQIPDRPAMTLVVLSPDEALDDPATLKTVEAMTREYGTSARTFKSALIWCVPDKASALSDEARKALAWEDIKDEDESRLDEAQKRQLAENLKKAQRDLKEAVWRTYKNVVLLGKDNKLRCVDLGLVHSSAADSMSTLVINRLRQDGDVEAGVSPTFLVRNWPPAFKEWSTKNVRDAFFASPQFPRLLNGDAVKDTIARGVSSGLIGYVGKTGGGTYEPFIYKHELTASEVEISDDMFIIVAAEADKQIQPPSLTALHISPQGARIEPGKKQTFVAHGRDQHGGDISTGLIDWKATGATIDAEGVLKAGPDEGSFIVTATTGNVSATANFVIAKAGSPPPPPPDPPPIKPVRAAAGLSWSGEVPPQKWMNFYTKVLAKFAAARASN